MIGPEQRSHVLLARSIHLAFSLLQSTVLVYFVFIKEMPPEVGRLHKAFRL